MKLWLDDVRPMPPDFDIHAKSSEEAIRILELGGVSFISFDHDLGDPDPKRTGYDVASWIESAAFYGTLAPLGWVVHSANPVGRKNIEDAMKCADEYWNKESR